MLNLLKLRLNGRFQMSLIKTIYVFRKFLEINSPISHQSLKVFTSLPLRTI